MPEQAHEPDLTDEEKKAFRQFIKEYERKRWAWVQFFKISAMVGGFVIFIVATAEFWAGLFKKLGRLFGG